MKSLGEIGYEAYRKQSGGVSLVSGKAIPQWSELSDEIKEAWSASARAVAEESPISELYPPAIALVCHEVNRAYGNRMTGDSHEPWEKAPEWQRESSIKCVRFLLENREAGPEALHDAWRAAKHAEGWQWGKTKNEEKKEHPCLVEFYELSKEQQAKDLIFHAIVRAMYRA